MFKKIKELKNAYQQGVIDSLADNSYLMIVVLLSLVNDINLKDKKQLFKIFWWLKFVMDFKKYDF